MVMDLATATQALQALDEPRAEAEWLLAQVTGLPRGRIQAGVFDALSPAQEAAFEKAVARRAAGEPFAYISGEQPFWKHSFVVTPAVLIPRPDTECLVEEALAVIGNCAAEVLDLCTGSGCVAVSLALDAPRTRVWASDVSAAALAVARDNAQRLSAPVCWAVADGLALPPDWPACFDVITANPPYIAEGDQHLPALRHEPQLALVSGTNGLALIRRLVCEAPARLNSGGALLLEHGHDQGGAVRDLMLAQDFTAVRTRRDYGGNERITLGFKR